MLTVMRFSFVLYLSVAPRRQKGFFMYYDAAKTGKRIQNLRREKGLTQERLAENLNISTDHMAKIEIGKRSCSLDVLVKAALFFDVTLDYLILGRTPENQFRDEIDSAIRILETLRNQI